MISQPQAVAEVILTALPVLTRLDGRRLSAGCGTFPTYTSS
jgi:hypothetical protein